MPITVCIDGAKKFRWEGNDAAIADIVSRFPETAKEVGETPDSMSNTCIGHLDDLSKLDDEEAKELIMTAVIWRILIHDAPSECGGGTIGDYASWREIKVDFCIALDRDGFHRRFNVYWS
jgi:hypothetical protein